MRNVVNISLPVQLTQEDERGVRELHFASKSEFFRHLVREWLAGHLLQELEESRLECLQGKAKKMTSIKQLWK